MSRRRPKFPPNPIVSPGFIDLLKKMMEKDPDNRITMKEILLNPWINAGYPINAHDELIKDMKIMLEEQILDKPVLSIYQVSLVQHYLHSFRRRKAAREAEEKRQLEMRASGTGQSIRKKTSKFNFDMRKPILTAKM